MERAAGALAIGVVTMLVACGTPVHSTPIGDPPGTQPQPASRADATPPPLPAQSWLKGSTHVHTIHSGDSTAPLGDVIVWYESHGYDFIVVTDHNRVSQIDYPGPLLVFGGIELTNNPPSCEPPPPEAGGGCRIHVNALFVAAQPDGTDGEPPPKIEWRKRGSILRVDLYQAAIDKSRELGGLVQLNHPSWHWGMDGPLLGDLGRRGVTLVEIANTSFTSWNAGDATHPSTEAIWDAALALGVTVFGVASDDAHHYDEAEIERRRQAGQPLYLPGGGWVMVRADRTAQSIRDALTRGDFYSSTGVLLDRVGVEGTDYVVSVADASPGEHTIEFILEGRAVHIVRGREARFSLADAPTIPLRATVSNDLGQRAWGQPMTLTAR